jgi:hypothetical protein
MVQTRQWICFQLISLLIWLWRAFRVSFQGEEGGELKGRGWGRRELAFYSTLRRTGCQFVDKWWLGHSSPEEKRVLNWNPIFWYAIWVFVPLCTLTLESHMCIFVRGAFVIGLLLMDLKTLALNDMGVFRLGSFYLILSTASSSKIWTP